MAYDCSKHGAFGWFELMTSDAEGAKKFYSELFGWEYEVDTSTGTRYTMAKVNGELVAGIMEQPEECKGMPPSWDIYVTTDDVDATTAKVEELGGKVLRAPADIPGVGRFSVIQDPQGAVIMAMSYKQG